MISSVHEIQSSVEDGNIFSDLKQYLEPVQESKVPTTTYIRNWYIKIKRTAVSLHLVACGLSINYLGEPIRKVLIFNEVETLEILKVYSPRTFECKDGMFSLVGDMEKESMPENLNSFEFGIPDDWKLLLNKNEPKHEDEVEKYLNYDGLPAIDLEKPVLERPSGFDFTFAEFEPLEINNLGNTKEELNFKESKFERLTIHEKINLMDIKEDEEFIQPSDHFEETLQSRSDVCSDNKITSSKKPKKNVLSENGSTNCTTKTIMKKKAKKVERIINSDTDDLVENNYATANNLISDAELENIQGILSDKDNASDVPKKNNKSRPKKSTFKSKNKNKSDKESNDNIINSNRKSISSDSLFDSESDQFCKSSSQSKSETGDKKKKGMVKKKLKELVSVGKSNVLGSTRSGRTVVKPLEYWRNEKIIH